ncbi:MAG: chemotaxis protein CheW [Gammaproteobacteria bacterium]|nr:chemotaxis protein CheW [Gammaproteobacteria bacterium]
MNSSQERTSTGEINQWVSFILGDEIYAIDVMKIQEVLRPVEITPVAGSPHYVMGVINLRGSVITVIDARKRFNLMPIDITDDTRILLVEVKKQVVGVLVDSIGEVLQVSQEQIEPAPNMVSGDISGNILGVITRGDVLVEIIDLDKLLAEELSPSDDVF